MRRLILTVLVLCSCLPVLAQNQVTNGSFE